MATRSLMTSAAALALSAGLAFAQTPAPPPPAPDHGAHHPGGPPPAAAAPRAPGAPGTPGAGPMGAGMMGGGMMSPGHMDQMMARMRDMHAMRMMGGDGGPGMMPTRHVEGRIAFLKAELGITEAQMPAWTALAEAMRAGAGKQRAAMPSAPAATLPDRADAMVAMMTARLEAMKGIATASRALYATLSETQKKTADELMMAPMGGPR